jgi:IclR family KDG regulon transcriptional repressor
MIKEQYATASLRSVHLALDVLEAVATAEDEIGVSDIAAHLNERKGTIFRHLRTLVDRGYLAQHSSTQRYRLGYRAHLLGQMAPDGSDMIASSTDAMKTLRDATGQTVVLSAVESNAVVVLKTVLGTSTFEIGVKPGSKLPVRSSAQGKIALAFAAHPLQLKSAKEARSPNSSQSDPVKLQRELAEVRKKGWATAPEEMMAGINALAAPILNEGGVCVGVVALVGLLQFIPAKPDSGQVAAVRAAALDISARMGYREQAIRA